MPSWARKLWFFHKLAKRFHGYIIGLTAAALRPGQGPRMSFGPGATNWWAVSPGAGTWYPPLPIPCEPFLAPLYGYCAVIPGAGTWFALNGQVAAPPGLLPPDCCRGRLRKRLESTPGISATKGKAVTASAARAIATREYFILMYLMWIFRKKLDARR